MRQQKEFQVQTCVTSQHKELLTQALDFFGVAADVDLNLMSLNQSLPSLTAKAVLGIADYLNDYRPDLLIIQGDTTTTFCAALAGFYHGVRIAHVEAGLRTGNKLAPYPEEVNRALTTRLADYHFAPTKSAKENLIGEGVPANQIFITGNTIIDALQFTVKKIRKHPVAITGLPAALMNGNLSTPLVLVTSHRRENFGPRLKSICEALRELARQFPDSAFVYPVHLNPNVQKPAFQLLTGIDNVFLLGPLNYPSFVALMIRSKFILSDSGGVQEEAPTLGKRVLVMRDTTERLEACETGTAKLVGTGVDQIVREARKLLSNNQSTELWRQKRNPFGDGKASERILNVLIDKLQLETI
jgi:UDP-N-acetylglucosamine 2-epimerase (non-hydrolysing)